MALSTHKQWTYFRCILSQLFVFYEIPEIKIDFQSGRCFLLLLIANRLKWIRPIHSKSCRKCSMWKCYGTSVANDRYEWKNIHWYRMVMLTRITHLYFAQDHLLLSSWIVKRLLSYFDWLRNEMKTKPNNILIAWTHGTVFRLHSDKIRWTSTKCRKLFHPQSQMNERWFRWIDENEEKLKHLLLKLVFYLVATNDKIACNR